MVAETARQLEAELLDSLDIKYYYDSDDDQWMPMVTTTMATNDYYAYNDDFNKDNLKKVRKACTTTPGSSNLTALTCGLAWMT